MLIPCCTSVLAFGVQRHLDLRLDHLVLAGANPQIVNPPSRARHVAGHGPLLQHKTEYQSTVLGRYRRVQHIVNIEALTLPIGVCGVSGPIRIRLSVEGTRASELHTILITVGVIVGATCQTSVSRIRLVGQLHLYQAYLVVSTTRYDIGVDIADVVKLKRYITQGKVVTEIYRIRDKHHIVVLGLDKLDGTRTAGIEVRRIDHA